MLELLAGRATVDKTARALHLSLRTVHRRLGALRATWGMSRTAQLVAHPRLAGLVGDLKPPRDGGTAR